MEFDFPIPHNFTLCEEETTITLDQATQVIELIGDDCWALWVENDKAERHVYVNSYTTRYARGNVNTMDSDKYIPNLNYEMEQFARDLIFAERKKFVATLRPGYTVHMVFGFNTFEHVILNKVTDKSFIFNRYMTGSLKPTKLFE
jgi:hypothetical protein